MQKNLILIILLIACVGLGITVAILLTKIQETKTLSDLSSGIPDAQAAITQLRKDSPKFRGVAIRKYTITDLNRDGKEEVVETINETEEKNIATLNPEIYPAFVWEAIYAINTAGHYAENYTDFKWYLNSRLNFYRLWENILKNPSVLTPASQMLVEKNKEKLLAALDELITRAQTLMK